MMHCQAIKGGMRISCISYAALARKISDKKFSVDGTWISVKFKQTSGRPFSANGWLISLGGEQKEVKKRKKIKSGLLLSVDHITTGIGSTWGYPYFTFRNLPRPQWRLEQWVAEREEAWT